MTNTLEKRFFFILLFVSTGIFAWVLTPFFSAIFWAVVLSLICFPMHKRFLLHTGNRRNFSAFMTVLVCTLIAVLPMVAFTVVIAFDLKELFDHIEDDGLQLDKYLNMLSDIPLISNFVDVQSIKLEEVNERVKSWLKESNGQLARNGFLLGQGLLSLTLQLGIMLYLMFFLLRDGRYIVEKMTSALPLNRKREALLISKIYTVVHSTIKGNIIVAVVQGVLGGIFFYFIGVPKVLLWTVAMSIAALVPAVGAAIVWAPVGLYLAFTGEVIKGIALLTYGALVISLVDNFLRPRLVSRETRLPDYLVLLSTAGGLVLMGIDGFIFGPLIAGIFIVLWQIFTREFNVDASNGSDMPTDESPIEESSRTGGEPN